MSSGAVAKRYANALFEVALERKELDQVEQELGLINQLLADHPTFVKFLYHPQIDNKVKKQEVKQIFNTKITDTVIDFISLLIDRNREDAIEAITESYVDLANKERDLADAIVTSVKPLSDSEQDNIANHFNQVMDKKIRIDNKVDPSILGGLVVKIGDRLYDGSVKGKLNRFKRRLV